MNNQIVKLIRKRLVKGEERYGKQNIASDGRDFIQEALEEALDCSVYLAGQLIEIQEKLKSKKKYPDHERFGDHCI
jgi:hypothetical protein